MKLVLSQRFREGHDSGCLSHQCLLLKICHVFGWTLEQYCRLPGLAGVLSVLALVTAWSFLSH